MSSYRSCFHLFVYGTLRSQYRNPDALRLHRSARLIGRGWVRGRLKRFKRYRGILLESNHTKWVSGEIYRLNTLNVFAGLDRYEGSDYERVLAKVRREEGGNIRSWIYQLRCPPAADKAGG